MTRKERTLYRWMMAVVALLLVATATRAAKADTILNFDQQINVNELGDGVFRIHMSFNAAQFQVWQQRFGSNPSLLRREVSKQLSQYEITDIQLDKNEMEREVDVTVKASGVTRNKGEGRIEMDVPKDWRLVNKDGNELKFNYLESVGNGVSIQHFITVELPEGATEVSDPAPSVGGQNRVTYQQPMHSQSNLDLILGGVLALLGATAVGMGLVKKF